MDRKQFIKTCGVACFGATAIQLLLQSCATTNYYAQHSLTGNNLSIKKTEFEKTEGEKKIHRKYILVKSDKFNFPICIYKLSENNYSAVLMECTHKSCELQPHGDYLICPCHGSEFSNLGNVQNPPAEQNLQTFKINTDHENIYIQL